MINQAIEMTTQRIQNNSGIDPDISGNQTLNCELDKYNTVPGSNRGEAEKST
jgi:hypothetical protein